MIIIVNNTDGECCRRGWGGCRVFFVFFCDSYLNLLFFCTCIVFYIRQQTQPKRLPNGMMQRWSNYFDLSFFLCNFVLSCICLVLYLRRRPVEDSPKCRRAPPAVRGVDTGGHCRPGGAGGDIEYFNWTLFVLDLYWILLSYIFTLFDCAILSFSAVRGFLWNCW